MKTYKVAFVYRKSNYYMSGSHFDNNMYNFYFKAMPRNPRINISYICDDAAEDEEWWIEKMWSAGFSVDQFHYDVGGIKSNWVTRHLHGNAIMELS